ncbi:hypothetical protein [Enterovibrio nigricans]|uniref:Uncharacterized protein n=1 Tax=Enterovibrio nigricans DSM 22720 TaxID=1121868 RepID=A0A1T4V5W2_9GAMM|nr:hypothetical protein [Enterovibrio nigricans]PKF49874.1 hypothetical protein AT251_15605 [Enterovibrio nigricans]SKA60274.1 hypothetical protein SAMN02745132_03265 [Enterovibrio nigricans DSM 22720]
MSANNIINNLRSNGGLPQIKNRRVFLKAATGDLVNKEVDGKEIEVPEIVDTEAWVEILPPQSTEFLRAFERSNIRQAVAQKKLEAIKDSSDVDEIAAVVDYAKGINIDILDEIVANWSEHFGVPCTKENKKELFSDPASEDIMKQILEAFQEVHAFLGK